MSEILVFTICYKLSDGRGAVCLSGNVPTRNFPVHRPGSPQEEGR
jgi:hypothetical protein